MNATAIRCGIKRGINLGEFLRSSHWLSSIAAGSRFVENLLTIMDTRRQQGRNAFEFITDATTDTRSRQPAPSLNPAP